MTEITVDNYLQHLDELTDEQITEFLNKDEVYKDEIQGIREDLRTTPRERWSQRGLWPLRTDRGIAEALACF